MSVLLYQVCELVHDRGSLESGICAPWSGLECFLSILNCEVDILWTGDMDVYGDYFAIEWVYDGESLVGFGINVLCCS
jgi:hypothetical protein